MKLFIKKLAHKGIFIFAVILQITLSAANQQDPDLPDDKQKVIDIIDGSALPGLKKNQLYQQVAAANNLRELSLAFQNFLNAELAEAVPIHLPGIGNANQ